MRGEKLKMATASRQRKRGKKKQIAENDISKNIETVASEKPFRFFLKGTTHDFLPGRGIIYAKFHVFE